MMMEMMTMIDDDRHQNHFVKTGGKGAESDRAGTWAKSSVSIVSGTLVFPFILTAGRGMCVCLHLQN